MNSVINVIATFVLHKTKARFRLVAERNREHCLTRYGECAVLKFREVFLQRKACLHLCVSLLKETETM